MADDQPTPGRQVHFEDDPASSSISQNGHPPFILIVTPPSPEFSSPVEDTPAFSPPGSPSERRALYARSPSPYPSRENKRSAFEALSSDNDSSVDGDDQEPWNQERASDGIEDSRASQTKNHFLYSYGDVRDSLDSTRRVLDELVTDFITELCFEASRSAQLSGRQKIKIDDIRFACRKSPIYLGKIQDIQEKKEAIDNARKTLDVNDDKITKSNVKAAMEEPPLGDGDDDPDMDTQVSRGKGK